MCFALGEMTARKNAQPKQKWLRIQLLAGDYMNKVKYFLSTRTARKWCKESLENVEKCPGATSFAGANEAVILR
jgi:hypothetical protein